MPTVSEVTQTVQKWLDGNCSQFPNFAGAFLFGGIVHLPSVATFPSYRDVDLLIVLNNPGKVQECNLEVLFEDVMIEVGFISIESLSSAEAILSDPSMASNFSATHFLADPLGTLKPLQAAVRDALQQRRWVEARCDTERKWAWQAIDAITTPVILFEKMLTLYDALHNLSGLVALAALQPPTHRRSLILSKKIFDQYQRAEVHEQFLNLWGSAELTRSEVQSLLERAILVFDRAVAVHQTPVPFDFKFKPHLRPYFLEASQEMIDEGHPREATFWIALPALVGALAVMADGTEEDKIVTGALVEDFYRCHRVTSPEDINARVPALRSLAKEVEDFTHKMIAGYEDKKTI